VSLFKSIFAGFCDLYHMSPLAVGPEMETQIDFDNLPGPAQDIANLAGDWQRVGGYLRKAMNAAEAINTGPAAP
jgi:hypothetical protein